MRRTFRALMLSLPTVAVAEVALAQMPFDTQDPPRATSAGVGTAALENQKGRGAILGPTAGAVGRATVGLAYSRSSLKFSSEGIDAEIVNSGPLLYGMAPLGGQASVGAAVALQSTENDVSGASASTSDSDTETKDDYYRLFGSYAVNGVTIGLDIRSQQHTEKDRYTSTSTGEKDVEVDESKGSVTSFTLGVALKPIKPLRVALLYQPKAVEKYKGTEERTSTNTTTNVTTTQKENSPEVLASPERITVAAAFQSGPATFVGGIERQVPYSVRYEVSNGRGGKSGTTDESSGSTIVSVGAEAGVAPGVTARGHVRNFASRDVDGQGLAVGADFVAGPVEISPTIAYDKLELDVDGGKDIEFTHTLLQLGVGATF